MHYHKMKHWKLLLKVSKKVNKPRPPQGWASVLYCPTRLVAHLLLLYHPHSGQSPWTLSGIIMVTMVTMCSHCYRGYYGDYGCYGCHKDDLSSYTWSLYISLDEAALPPSVEYTQFNGMVTQWEVSHRDTRCYHAVNSGWQFTRIYYFLDATITRNMKVCKRKAFLIWAQLQQQRTSLVFLYFVPIQADRNRLGPAGHVFTVWGMRGLWG